MNSGLVKIYSGSKRKKFDVHRDLLFTTSKYFKDEFSIYGRGVSNIFFTNEDPTNLEPFINWLYRRTLDPISQDDEHLAKRQVVQYIHLYTRAQTWQTPALQNSIMDCLRARRTCDYGWFPPTHINYVYQHTLPGCPLRKYIVDSFLWKGSRWDGLSLSVGLTRVGLLREHLEHGNQEFVLECYEVLFLLCAKKRFVDPGRRVG
ncbi:MAG: hypothetical protein Q9164_001196, partial [Protoblastenia rupestris]